MIVKQCKTPEILKAEVVLLSLSDIQQKEGVYRIHGLFDDLRFVVIRAPKKNMVLYFNTSTLQLEVADTHWSDYRFVKTNEEVYFALK